MNIDRDICLAVLVLATFVLLHLLYTKLGVY